VGRGKSFGSNLPKWADEVVGGWQLSGLVNWRTGLAFQTVANAFPISFANNVPAIFNGKHFRDQGRDSPGGQRRLGISHHPVVQQSSECAWSFQRAVGIAGREPEQPARAALLELRHGLGKHFPIRERVVMEFRTDAFNVFNHANFGLPGASGTADITSPSTFGVISNTVSSTSFRRLQMSLRLDF